MKELFHIKELTEPDPSDRLGLQIGEKHIAFAITDQSASRLKVLVYAISSDTTGGMKSEDLSGVLQTYPVLKSQFSKVTVSYDSADAIFFTNSSAVNHELFNLLHGLSSDSKLVTTNIQGWPVSNHSSVPDNVNSFIEVNFGKTHLHHLYSVQLMRLKTRPEKDYLFIDFRNEEFSVIALRHKQLIIAQTFSYSVPADVLYYLLRICQYAGFVQDEVILNLSGLVEKQSVLFQQLYQYFTHISLREPAWIQHSDYPAHFFTTLNDLLLCES